MSGKNEQVRACTRCRPVEISPLTYLQNLRPSRFRPNGGHILPRPVALPHDERSWLGKATSSPSENPEDPAKKCHLRLLQFGANGHSTILFLWIEVLCRWYRT